ncbi:rootletin [Aspergillus luchuensis]|uniref:Rootletin n=1 Tax=Aspergillus kawachii TaxID=1069201 RepID=A0A146FSD6_ASPKA|nr:rootletin [Aspergillus luchuensis]
MKEEMEAKIKKAAEENNILKGQLEESCQHIQKQSSQLQVYKSRMETWRSKFAKFRSFLNELGCDFQSLRGEAIQLKGTRKELLIERNEISTSIKEAKAQLAKVSTDAEHKRGELSKVESQNDLLKQSLKDAEERSNYLLTQLSDEKKRSSLLEVYIQNCARAQSTKLDKIMSHQREIRGGFDAALKSLGDQHVASIKALQEGLSCDFSGCLASLRELWEGTSSGKADVAACTAIIHAFAARMDSAMHQLDAGIARGTEATAGLTESLKAQTEVIGKHVVSENQLVAKISKDSETNESLRNALRELAAANEDINVSMKGLEARESGLLDQFTALEASLSAMQLPDQRQILKEETQRFEQTLAEMERKIQSLSEQSKLAEEALRNKDLENQALRGSLETASAKVEDDDSRVRRCEAEVATLKDEVKSVEARVRKELSRASVVSREQDRARYEQKIHELLRGKSEIERNLSKVSMQLAETRRDLVSFNTIEGQKHTDARKMLREDKMKQRVNELELLLGSKEKENERLKNDLSEITSKLEEEKHEAARLEEVASSSAAEQASLQHQIEEAAHRISCLEGECSRISKEGSKSIENIESKHDMLCKELQKKEDECVLIQSQLKATISEKAELECSKGRAAEEIKSLLRRVQNSEKWMNKLKATLGQAGLVTPDQPASEAWSSLETSLRTVISRDAACNSLNSSPGGNQDVGGSKARSSTLGQDVYKATEVIYKAESFQASIISSPFPAKANPTENDAAKQSFCSAQNPNIVPFSSFRQRSPTDSSVFGNDQDDLAAMLLLTSEQQVPNEVHSVNKPVEAQSTGSASVAVSAKSKVLQPDPQDMNDEKALETKCSTRGTATKSKGVTFEAQSTASPGQKRKLSARSNISPSQWRSQSIEDRPARLNRRTYARARQPATRTLANLEEQSTCLPRNEIADEAAHATASCSIGSKRAKASVDQKPQTKPVSEYFERKPSPKKLASGSSRPSSLNASQGTNLKRAARGKGTGRKTRAEEPEGYMDKYVRQQSGEE